MSSKLNIKKDDKVLVKAGREKGKVGKVLKVDPVKMRAVVEKVNMIKRHTRAGQAGTGGIMEKRGAPGHQQPDAFVPQVQPARAGEP